MAWIHYISLRIILSAHGSLGPGHGAGICKLLAQHPKLCPRFGLRRYAALRSISLSSPPFRGLVDAGYIKNKVSTPSSVQ